MSSPESLEKARSLSRPVTQLKNVSSCAISIGPSFAISATRGCSSATFSTRALISTLRAMRSLLLQPHAAALGARQLVRAHRRVDRKAPGAMRRQVETDEHEAAGREDSAHAAVAIDERD